MPTTDRRARRRAPLTRERVLRAAVKLADKGGLPGVSTRKLGQVLGVEAMSLYKHVANKDEILDGLVDSVFAEIGLPPAMPIGGPRCATARSQLVRSCSDINGRSACSIHGGALALQPSATMTP